MHTVVYLISSEAYTTYSVFYVSSLAEAKKHTIQASEGLTLEKFIFSGRLSEDEAIAEILD